MMTDWLQPIDAYCERAAVGFWAEPINAATNLAFVLAGWLIWRCRHSSDRLHAHLLGATIVLIGLGSFLFHTFANRITGLLDVIFIALYLLLYVWLWPRRLFQAGPTAQVVNVLGLMACVTVCNVVSKQVTTDWPTMPPSLYIGAWLYLVAMAAASVKRQPTAARWMFTAAGVFVLSLIARQLDQPLCQLSGGTHWAWHLLNALVLYASARGVLTTRKGIGCATLGGAA